MKNNRKLRVDRFKHLLYWFMMILGGILGFKGRIVRPSEWNLWSLPAVLILIGAVIFAVAYDLKVTPFWRRAERRLMKSLEGKKNNGDYSSQIKRPDEPGIDKFNDKESYEFEYVLTDEESLQRLINYIMEEQSIIASDRQNLQLAYGVVDKERTIFVTLTYYLSDNIKRCDDGIDAYKYAVITKDEIFTVSCQSGRGRHTIGLEMGNHQKYESIVRQAITFYYTSSTFDWEKKLKEADSGFNLYQYNQKLKETYIDGMGFSKDVLSYSGELDENGYKKLQAICDVLNSQGVARVIFSGYKVEDFQMRNKYEWQKYRFINEEGDVWIYFMGCTDSTHAPADYMESEWLMFYYRGFAAELHFEEQSTVPKTFKFKFVFVNGYHITDIKEFHTILLEKEIPVDTYYHVLRRALNAQRPNSSNYYVF